jgi:hypothetical protein
VGLIELVGELPDNAFTEHISHFEYLYMDLVIGSNGCRMVAI